MSIQSATAPIPPKGGTTNRLLSFPSWSLGRRLSDGQECPSYVDRNFRSSGRTLKRLILVLTILAIWCLQPTICPAQDTQNPPAEISDSSEIEAPISVTSALDILELLGIGESELAKFQHNQDFLADEKSTLLRIMARLPRFPQQYVSRLQKTNLDWESALEQPERLRAQLVRVTGKLTKLERVRLDSETAERLRFDSYFQITVRDQDQDVIHTAFLREIPVRFLKAIDEGMSVTEGGNPVVGFTGLFLKRGANRDASEPNAGAETADAAAELLHGIFAGNELEWFPSDPDSPLLDGNDDLAALGKFGMNVGALGTVRDRKPLSNADRDAFYQMLASIGSQTNADIIPLATKANATTLLKNPESHRGKIYAMNGTARRCIRIKVTDPDIVARFGIRQYFEIEVFDNSAYIKVRDREDSTRAAEYGSYPVVFCSRTIPEGFPTGDLIHENVQINGAYLKLWAYPTKFIRSQIGEDGGPPPLQISPMLIGRSPMFLEPPPPNRSLGMAVAVGFSLLILGIWAMLAKSRRGDQDFRDKVIEPHVSHEWSSDENEVEAMEDALQNLKTTFVDRNRDA